MTFDYNTLKIAAKDGVKLGNWYGKFVFAASVKSLDNKGSGVYYILYDDKNKIVARTDSGWKIFGEVTTQGSVNEYSRACDYKTPAEVVAAACKAKEERSYSASGMRSAATLQSEPIPQATMTVGTGGSYSPGYDRTEKPMGDVKLEIDIEKVLKIAREMTVESLLEGFLPGVSFDMTKD